MRVHDDEGTDVGVLWLGPNLQRPGVVHVFEIEIDRAHRGRGLGRVALLAAEDLVRAQGLTEISLNAFGFNDPARRLYDRLGYRGVSTAMTKTLEPGSD
jgi:ribosomal protein S18 acetylase RimI-like enzyme